MLLDSALSRPGSSPQKPRLDRKVAVEGAPAGVVGMSQLMYRACRPHLQEGTGGYRARVLSCKVGCMGCAAMCPSPNILGVTHQNVSL